MTRRIIIAGPRVEAWEQVQRDLYDPADKALCEWVEKHEPEVYARAVEQWSHLMMPGAPPVDIVMREMDKEFNR
jgi:hypothetical protein